MDMQFNDDRELVLFLKPDKKKDKNTLNLAKQVSAHIRDVDVMKENLTATKIIEILQILNLKPQDLIDKESDIYMKEYKGKDLDEDSWVKAMANFPELIRTPIAFLGKRGMVVETPSNVLKLDPNEGYNSLKE